MFFTVAQSRGLLVSVPCALKAQLAVLRTALENLSAARQAGTSQLATTSVERQSEISGLREMLMGPPRQLGMSGE